MRRPATGAPRPPRHQMHRTVRAANRPGAGPAPPGQHARASRTRQPARPQAFLDPVRVGLYREHRASERTHTALPHASGQGREREGRGLPRPEDRHGGGADEPGQHDPPGITQICTLNGANPVLCPHPEWRPTHDRVTTKISDVAANKPPMTAVVSSAAPPPTLPSRRGKASAHRPIAPVGGHKQSGGSGEPAETGEQRPPGVPCDAGQQVEREERLDGKCQSRASPRERGPFRLHTRIGETVAHRSRTASITSAVATATARPVGNDDRAAGRGRLLRNARSVTYHPTHACTGAINPATMRTSDAASRYPGCRSRASASNATPAATRARPVRIQARNVRSLARVNRGSGSEPSRNSRRGNRRSTSPPDGFPGSSRVESTAAGPPTTGRSVDSGTQSQAER